MAHQFKKHYTRDEARALLPRLRKWLDALSDLQQEHLLLQQRLSQMMQSGQDAGGNLVNQSTRVMGRIQTLLAEFQSRHIFIKDVDRGLVDFPALIAGREVFLCWEKEEEDVEFWHEIEAGFQGREPL